MLARIVRRKSKEKIDSMKRAYEPSGDDVEMSEKFRKELTDLNTLIDAAVQTDPHFLTFTPEGQKRSVEETWLAVEDTIPGKTSKDIDDKLENLKNRTGWKTIRVFVSSTFKDFHSERESLVKEIFPDLREWCKQRQLHLVECDLRWGVPSDVSNDKKLSSCLEELDLCRDENIFPFFLSLTGDRTGWIPDRRRDAISDDLITNYKWIFGLSLTEMEIVHAAIRPKNPNALFLIRESDFLESVPDEFKNTYVDHESEPEASVKIPVLKRKIEEYFEDSQVLKYTCEYAGVDTQRSPVLKLNSSFRQKIEKFFKDRISSQYPLLTEAQELPWYKKHHISHESFVESKVSMMIEHRDLINKVVTYVEEPGEPPPLFVHGDPGVGKTSMMAGAVAHVRSTMSSRQVFYHFVGAVPDSVDLYTMLRRMLLELNAADENNLPSDVSGAVHAVVSALKNPEMKPAIVFVDAVNQFQQDDIRNCLTWLPRRLGKCARCIVSKITDSMDGPTLAYPEPQKIRVGPLTLRNKKDLMQKYLRRYGKVIDVDHFVNLVEKDHSDNALWLTLACEELRVFGLITGVSDQAKNLPDNIEALVWHLVKRLVTESGHLIGSLLMAALCLLQVSPDGLQEDELKVILADADFIVSEANIPDRGNFDECCKLGHLWPYIWCNVHRGLRAFIRPLGDSGQGRLGFYHQSLSNALKHIYIKPDGTQFGERCTKDSPFWHKKLVDYFSRCNDEKRRVEALPHHLMALGHTDPLRTFLCQWSVFSALFDEDFSSKLVRFWQACSNTEEAVQCYKRELKVLRCADNDKAQFYQKVARFLLQAGAPTTDVLKLAKEGERYETNLGSHPELQMTVWALKADLHMQQVRDQKYLTDDPIQLEWIETTVGLYRDIVNRRKSMAEKDKDNQEKLLAINRLKLSFVLSVNADWVEEKERLKSMLYRKECREHLSSALQFFRRTKDGGREAEVLMNQGSLELGRNDQMKKYEKAWKKCMEVFGRYHQLAYRIKFNMAFCYQNGGHKEKAYDELKAAREIAQTVFGEGHKKVKDVEYHLKKPWYQKIAVKLSDREILDLEVPDEV